MRAIIGLGNPGSEYDGSRHNIGFAVVDAVADHYGVRFHAGAGEYRVASVSHGPEILLVKPSTYMNNSGIAVKEVFERFKIRTDDLLVIVDDFHLPLGSVRLRRRGSSAGHNGLSSIIWHLNSDEFPRLRCGIDSELKPKDKLAKADFVLSRFAGEELGRVRQMIENARDIAIVAAQENLRAATDHVSRLIQ